MGEVNSLKLSPFEVSFDKISSLELRSCKNGSLEVAFE
jgi:hypothetical protein